MNRVAVVTGASRGLGAAIAERLADDGMDLWLLARDGTALDTVRSTLAHRNVETAVCDVTDEEQVRSTFATIGPVDVLVLNAGAATAGPVTRVTTEEWNRLFAVNATAPLLCVQAALPTMLERRWGRIVAIGSTGSLAGFRYTAPYTASKHALLGLMRVVAAETAGTGVTANVVCPTFIDSDMTRQTVDRIVRTTGRTVEEARASLVESLALGRLLQPAEVAHAVSYLASERSGAVNGSTIVLDGGELQR